MGYVVYTWASAAMRSNDNFEMDGITIGAVDPERRSPISQQRKVSEPKKKAILGVEASKSACERTVPRQHGTLSPHSYKVTSPQDTCRFAWLIAVHQVRISFVSGFISCLIVIF